MDILKNILKNILKKNNVKDCSKNDYDPDYTINILGVNEFSASMDALDYILSDFTISNIDKLIVIDILLKSVKYDIQNYYSTKIAYKYNKKTNCIFDDEKKPSILPYHYMNKTGDFIKITECGKKKIYFAKDIVVSMPWNLKRYIDANINIHNNVFKYHNSNHFATYYKGLDITFIDNGYHSSFAGIINKKGYIVSDIIDVEKIFDYIDIDENLQYIDVNSKTTLSSEIDFRIAILYKISKIKFELLKKIKFEEKYIQNKDKSIFFIGNCQYEIKSEFKETDDIVYLNFTIYKGNSMPYHCEEEVEVIAKSKAQIIKEFKFLNIIKFEVVDDNYLNNPVVDKLIKENIETSIYYGARSIEIQFFEKDNYVKKDIIHFFSRNNLEYFIDKDKNSIIGYKKLETKKTLKDIININ